MPVKPYSTVHLVLPITPRTIVQLNKMREELTRTFGGSTLSRVALPSPFVGYWVTLREGEEIVVVDDLSITIVDVDIEQHPNYLDYFETLKATRMDRASPDYLGEDEIWILVYNSHRIM